MAGPNPVARHYGSGGIAERVIAALREAKGPEAPLTPENLAQFDHFHGRGVAATEELAAQLQPQSGERLLDIGPAGEPYFPVPWATTRDTSFLATPEEMRADLLAAGFEIVSFRDTTEAVREVQRRTRERLEKGELPRVAADIILGERAREMQINSLRSTEEGRGIAIEALVRKPS